MAFRDAAKVLIIDETQDLSKEAINSCLRLTESPQKGIHYIFCSMGRDLKGGDLSKALVSRCKKWKLKDPTVDDIYLYLIKVALSKGLVTAAGKSVDAAIPDAFWTPTGVIRRIVENADYSYRRALQLLEQAIEGELYTIEDLNETLDLGSYDEMLTTVKKLADGLIDDVVVDTITGTKYQDDFALIYKIIGDAETVRVLGRLSSDERDAWKATQPKAIAAAPFFPEVRDAFKEIAKLNTGYLRRGYWQMQMATLVETINAKRHNPLRESVKATRRSA
jgi:DNA polymerase III delta prime subunit